MNLHEAGYSIRRIEKVLKCSHRTIRKYLNSDKESICSTILTSGVDNYHDVIVKSLSEGMCRSELYRKLQEIGLKCGKTAAYDYFNKIARLYNIELTPLESCTQEQKQKRKNIKNYIYISRKKIFDYLWFDTNLEIEKEYFDYLLKEYPIITTLKVLIRNFRMIFEKQQHSFLYSFINKYKESSVKLLSHFATGLEKDIEAVGNAVTYPYSNGFVEGTNNKIKMLKRTMYGRCGSKLLAAKLMLRL